MVRYFCLYPWAISSTPIALTPYKSRLRHPFPFHCMLHRTIDHAPAHMEMCRRFYQNISRAHSIRNHATTTDTGDFSRANPGALAKEAIRSLCLFDWITSCWFANFFFVIRWEIGASCSPGTNFCWYFDVCKSVDPDIKPGKIILFLTTPRYFHKTLVTFSENVTNR